MPKKSKIRTVELEPVYYICYDKKTGNIIAAINEEDSRYENKLVVSPAEYSEFVSGRRRFSDYIVDYVGPANSQTLEIIPASSKNFKFKNNLLENITPITVNSDVTIVWQGMSKCWKFNINESVALKSKRLPLDFKLVFFVTLENDYDFLVRTILIDVHRLIQDKEILIPFVSILEEDCKRISISTKKHFDFYRLIINEQD